MPKLGGLEDAQVERIFALKPDLVLAGKSARVLDRLEALGLKVVALETESLADLRRTVETVALLLGRAEAAGAFMTRIDRRVGAATQRIPQRWRGARVYFEVAATPHAAGEASYIGELIARLGLANVIPASLGPFPQLNPEFVVRARPELLMASQSNLAGMPRRPGWNTIPALAAGHVCGFDVAHHDVFVRPGPRLAEAAEAIADCLQALPRD